MNLWLLAALFLNSSLDKGMLRMKRADITRKTNFWGAEEVRFSCLCQGRDMRFAGVLVSNLLVSPAGGWLSSVWRKSNGF